MKLLLLFVVALAAMWPLDAAQAQNDGPSRVTFDKLLAATVANDHAAFVAECDATMKAALTPAMLEKVSGLIAPHYKGGCDVSYLGELRQQGFQVELYRLRYKDGSDDTLGTMSVKDGKVGGYYLR